MRVSVIGCGYLGAVHAAAMAELGHEVVGIDVDERKIAALAAGHPPFFEPGLPEILTSATASGRLRFSTDIADAADAEVHFLAVGTPQAAGSNAADLRYVDAAFDRTAAAPRRRRPRRGQEHGARRHSRSARGAPRRGGAARLASPGTPSSCARASP